MGSEPLKNTIITGLLTFALFFLFAAPTSAQVQTYSYVGQPFDVSFCQTGHPTPPPTCPPVLLVPLKDQQHLQCLPVIQAVLVRAM
jgi:hypothetical protein